MTIIKIPDMIDNNGLYLMKLNNYNHYKWIKKK